MSQRSFPNLSIIAYGKIKILSKHITDIVNGPEKRARDMYINRRGTETETMNGISQHRGTD